MAEWWLAAPVLLLIVLTLPGTVELALVTFGALLPARQLADADISGARDVRLAIIVPAHNEEAGLPATLKSLLACHDPPASADIVVVADNCTDSTAAIARSHGVTVLERHDTGRRGKGYALDHAFRHLADQERHGAGYTAYAVVDADTLVDPGFCQALTRAFAIGADACQCVYRVGNADANQRTRLQNIAFLAFNLLRPAGRERLGLSAGILGTGFALRADVVRAVPYDSFSIVEDLEYHLRLVRAGYRVRFLRETAVWSDMPVSGAASRSQRARWEGGRLRLIREHAPALAAEVMTRGRLSLLEPLLELLLLPLSYHVLLLAILTGLAALSGSLASVYAITALAVVALHVALAMVMGGAGARDWQALMTAPFLLAWKLANFPAIIRAATGGAEWKRTSRS
jgi:cellulose synthase/poly-beta-1,6-N-acetylglucosamine synthase-like glycosyltransferase